MNRCAYCLSGPVEIFGTLPEVGEVLAKELDGILVRVDRGAVPGLSHYVIVPLDHVSSTLELPRWQTTISALLTWLPGLESPDSQDWPRTWICTEEGAGASHHGVTHVFIPQLPGFGLVDALKDAVAQPR